jgi:hypothetical protein
MARDRKGTNPRGNVIRLVPSTKFTPAPVCIDADSIDVVDTSSVVKIGPISLALFRESQAKKGRLPDDESAVVQHLEDLLKEARLGRVSGLVWAALVPRRGGFFADTAGVLDSDTGRARSILRTLDNDLTVKEASHV